MKHYIKFVPTILSAAILSACGGGGGSTGSSTSPTPPPASSTSTVSFDMTLAPTATNMTAVAQWHAGAADQYGHYQAYTPDEIRTAYSMPSLKNATPAQMGAGQTIYIIDSNNDPQILAELMQFSKQYNLPGCTSVTITSSNIGKAAVDGCQIGVVYLDTNGAVTTSQPQYDNDWATEIALDVEWAHATAPFARIVLIETPNNNVATFANAIKFVNAAGQPGAVSMSFAAPEGSYVSGYDSLFTAPGITYLAAAGDDGEQVNWPAASSKVVAVGGTAIVLDSNNQREFEYAWGGTGGGVSAYESAPVYQATLKNSKRVLNDVSFNADPTTGQFIVTLQPSQTAVAGNFSTAPIGGTSLATPQWAGLVVIANAERADLGLQALGDIHTALYQNSYVFNDVTQEEDPSFPAQVGYDMPTGLGSPIVSNLLPLLVQAPVEQTNANNLTITVSDLTGTFTVADSATDNVHVTVSGVPAGLTFTPNGSVVTLGMTGVTCSCDLKITVNDGTVTQTTTMSIDIG